jgi:hypothetical protein
MFLKLSLATKYPLCLLWGIWVALLGFMWSSDGIPWNKSSIRSRTPIRLYHKCCPKGSWSCYVITLFFTYFSQMHTVTKHNMYVCSSMLFCTWWFILFSMIFYSFQYHVSHLTRLVLGDSCMGLTTIPPLLTLKWTLLNLTAIQTYSCLLELIRSYAFTKVWNMS